MVSESILSPAVLGTGAPGVSLTEEEIRVLVEEAFAREAVAGARLLVVVPDGTRTAPIELMARVLHDTLHREVAALDYLIALGTHQPMTPAQIESHFGISAADLASERPKTKIYNHRWEDPRTFRHLGTISEGDMNRLSRGLMNESVEVRMNALVFEYDMVVICGPTFPHEVVGFSGGNKYFFPGISAGEMIDASHWLGALMTSHDVIGTLRTPVRDMIDTAASLIGVEKRCLAMVVSGTTLAGLYWGSPEEAYAAAAELSRRVHIQWVDRPFRRVLAVMPRLYDDMWTGAKGMYKTEPAVADDGEVVIYAPHIDETSYTHRDYIEQVGYHVRDYFTSRMERFAHIPRGILAHSTHVRGPGTYDPATDTERPRIQVTFATGIDRERCRRLGVGYLDPASVDIQSWSAERDDEVLFVPKAGEILYRVRDEPTGDQSL